MPQLVDGIWVTGEVAAGEVRDGAFHREPTRFRRWLTADGGPVDPAILTPDLVGTTPETLPAEPGRYRLYVAKICPWASRTLIARAVMGLGDMLPVTVSNPLLGAQGWTFLDADGRSRDPEHGISYLHQLYVRAAPHYSGKVSVPVLWDTKTGEIVNNESADILRMLGSAFAGHDDSGLDLYPADLRASIDGWNARIYETLNNGVYRAGFAKSRVAYEAAFDDVFGMLEALDAHLSTSRYVTGRWLTEADWRLFVTIVRFDAAYHGLFKCNLRPISSYPSLSGWMRELHQWPGIAETVSIDHIKRGYWSIAHLNPSGIVPKGPEIDFASPHGRERLVGRGIRRRGASVDG